MTQHWFRRYTKSGDASKGRKLGFLCFCFVKYSHKTNHRYEHVVMENSVGTYGVVIFISGTKTFPKTSGWTLPDHRVHVSFCGSLFSPNTNMTLEKTTMNEDVFPIENG